MLGWLLYPLVLTLYLLRLAVFYSYGFLVFLSKPFARLFLPVLTIGLVILFPGPIDRYLLTETNIAVLARWIPADPQDGAAVFGITLVVLFVAVIWFGSKAIRPVLGAIPPMRRPMPPRRSLRARDKMRPPASSSIAVPSLERQFWGGEEHHLTRRLPEHLQALLQPKEAIERAWVDLSEELAGKPAPKSVKEPAKKPPKAARPPKGSAASPAEVPPPSPKRPVPPAKAAIRETPIEPE